MLRVTQCHGGKKQACSNYAAKCKQFTWFNVDSSLGLPLTTYINVHIPINEAFYCRGGRTVVQLSYSLSISLKHVSAADFNRTHSGARGVVEWDVYIVQRGKSKCPVIVRRVDIAMFCFYIPVIFALNADLWEAILSRPINTPHCYTVIVTLASLSTTVVTFRVSNHRKLHSHGWHGSARPSSHAQHGVNPVIRGELSLCVCVSVCEKTAEGCIDRSRTETLPSRHLTLPAPGSGRRTAVNWKQGSHIFHTSAQTHQPLPFSSRTRPPCRRGSSCSPRSKSSVKPLRDVCPTPPG